MDCLFVLFSSNNFTFRFSDVLMGFIIMIYINSNSLMHIIKANILLLIAIFHLQTAYSVQSNSPPQTNLQNCTLPEVTNNPNIMLIGSCPQQIFIIGINIGTEPQSLYFIVDTSQQFLQVLINQSNQIGFAINESSTAQLSGQFAQIELANGQMIPSELGSDIVSFNSSSINTKSDMFFVDTPIQNQYFQVISGVFGVGIGRQYQNIFQIASANSQINSASCILSLSLTNQSYLYYNQLPSEITDNSIFMKSTSNQQYTLKIIGLFIDGTDYSDGAPTQAILASGDNFFYLNKKIYSQAVSTYFSNCIQTQQGPSCNCSTVASWPIFSFMFTGGQIFIPGQSYIAYLPDGNCTYGFGYIQNDKQQMVLGTSFFVNYNVTLNPKQKKIGLQGNISPVQLIDFEYFVVLSYIYLVVGIGMVIAGGLLLCHLRLIEKEKPTRSIEFSISDRFIQTQ